VVNGVRETGADEGDVNPGQIAAGAGKLIELSLLPDPEDAVAQGGQALHAQSGNTVVEGRHRTDFAGSKGTGKT
jgi:hypothetical protein